MADTIEYTVHIVDPTGTHLFPGVVRSDSEPVAAMADIARFITKLAEQGKLNPEAVVHINPGDFGTPAQVREWVRRPSAGTA